MIFFKKTNFSQKAYFGTPLPFLVSEQIKILQEISSLVGGQAKIIQEILLLDSGKAKIFQEVSSPICDDYSLF